MLIYRNPNKCAFMSCNRRCKKLLCKNHINKKLDFVPYFIQINPFYLELIIINLQTFWKNKLLLRKNKFIIKNFKNIVNNKDPISRDILIINGHLQENIDLLYPIIINNFIYLYKLENLLYIINTNCKEVITNTLIDSDEIKKIKILCVKLNLSINNEEFSEEELFHFKKIKTFQKLDILGTYFPINIYNKISLEEKKKIYQELRLMWNAFCIDNNINEIKLFKKNINWLIQDNIDKSLVDKINLLLNDNIDENLKKMISYLIIGAFAYINFDIKKIYNNFDFI